MDCLLRLLPSEVCDCNATLVGSIPTRGNELLFINIFISSLVSRLKARCWVPPLNMQSRNRRKSGRAEYLNTILRLSTATHTYSMKLVCKLFNLYYNLFCIRDLIYYSKCGDDVLTNGLLWVYNSSIDCPEQST